ncbi:MAG: L-serine ammonia-lyase, iron-sulfur-dependent, subunit alpha [Lachnobacterium sp.]|nr:L-serine ammonia-lyase, iron-sulfur-dependent, subunit alpha [Lachnobacterium sp.]
MSFARLKEITDISNEEKIPFWEVVLRDDMKERNVSREASFQTMDGMLTAMEEADRSYSPELKSASGLAGGDGAKLEAAHHENSELVGDFISEVMERAVKMGESNACMKRIVAMPTAGSCGVIPAVIITYMKQKNVDRHRIVEALYVAGGIGEVIAASASIAGAEGGCQAEIGSASAMAAGAIAYLEGGDNEEIVNASALALKNMLGLTCDPVAGLVEVPCIKRNVSGAVNAVVSSRMAMSGIRSAIEPDEVIDSMRRIGKLMPACLRETGEDGLASTKSGIAIANKIAKVL